MRILILYDNVNSKAAEIANEILENVDSEFKRAFPVNNAHDACLLKYDFIILGGSVSKRSIPRELKQYVQRNMRTLKGKNIGIFITTYEKEKESKYLYKLYSKELVSSAYLTEFFYDENINTGFFSRPRTKTPNKGKINELNKSSIKSFIDKINELSARRKK